MRRGRIAANVAKLPRGGDIKDAVIALRLALQLERVPCLSQLGQTSPVARNFRFRHIGTVVALTLPHARRWPVSSL